MERKLFTSLQGHEAQDLNDTLSHQGFRRSQNVLYRPSCTECNACTSARIDVAKFTASKSQKRILKRNADLVRRATSPWATEEQYDLFRSYLEARHADGGMADMDVFEFAAMIEETPIRTRVVEYSDGAGDLIGVTLTDVLEDGVSMVYSFFRPDQARRSLGTYLILDHIQIARDNNKPYVYLGYWVPGSPKMDYKAKFSGLEIYAGGAWRALPDPAAYVPDSDHADAISDQVANITLPNSADKEMAR